MYSKFSLYSELKMATLLVCLFAISLSYGQSKEHSKTNNQFELEPLYKKLNKTIENEHIPGMLLSIVKGNDVIFNKGLGFANLKDKTKVNKYTMFRLGSITKSFTSLAIISLVAEGKISLNDKLKKIAPEIEFNNKWENTCPVRIINLLEHTAGFDDTRFKAIYNQSKRDLTTFEAIKINNSSLQCRWKPGERMSYSNPDYVILGYIIEKVSGQKWDQYIREKILIPLDMKNTNFDLRIKNRHNYALPYKFNGITNVEIPFYPMIDGASGSLNTCGDDMSKFILFFLNNWKVNQKQLLPISFLDEMEMSHSDLGAINGFKNGYGMGNTILSVDSQFIFHGHSGALPGFTSKYGYNRKLKIGFTVSSNNEENNDKIAKIIIDYLTSTLMPPKKLNIKDTLTDETKKFLGYYQFSSPRYKFLGFLEEPFSVKFFSMEKNKLKESTLTGGTILLDQISEFQFKEPKHCVPNYFFTQNNDGERVLISNKEYYIKKSLIWISFQQIAIILPVLCIIIIFILGTIFTILRIINKKHQAKFKKILLLYISTISFFLFIVLLHYLAHNITLTTTKNEYTLSIFFLGFLFSFTSIIHLLMVLNKIKTIKSKLDWFVFVNSIFINLLTFILIVNEWIGLKTWSY